MTCPKCGEKTPADAVYCPNCGAKLGGEADLTAAVRKVKAVVAKKAPRVQQAVSQAAKQAGPTWRRLRRFKYLAPIIAALVLLVGGGFAYKSLYLPGVVRSALTKSQFATMSGYTVHANTWTKRITITADEHKSVMLADAVAANNFSGTHIGAEMQLATLVQNLPGKWTAEIRQTGYQKSPAVLWRYQGQTETVRFQNTDEIKLLRQKYLTAKANAESSHQALTDAMAGAVIGGIMYAALH